MAVTEILERLGGVASWSTLARLTTRPEIDRAVMMGDVVRDARGRYALPHADDALRAANRLTGYVSHRSAASYWGWAQKTVPPKPEVTVPKNRILSDLVRREVNVHWRDLPACDVDGRVTTRSRTIVDLLRVSEPLEAIAVADSALRARDFTSESLARLARDLRGPGSVRARSFAAAASALAANPFESVLRALALEAGLDVRPQVPLYGADFLGRPDLVDVERRLILEADSFEWHGNRAALVRDTRRYNAFVVHGWTVLRFSWEDVMTRPQLVLETLRAVAQLGTKAV